MDDSMLFTKEKKMIKLVIFDLDGAMAEIGRAYHLREWCRKQ